jgi:hypothetical protein
MLFDCASKKSQASFAVVRSDEKLFLNIFGKKGGK